MSTDNPTPEPKRITQADAEQIAAAALAAAISSLRLAESHLAHLPGWRSGFEHLRECVRHEEDHFNRFLLRQFNKDLFAATLLVLDDKGASANLADRRQRGEGLKDLIWKPEQRMEGKGADALVLRPFWRCVIAGNDDEAGLQVRPALSPSLEDKLLILLARQAEELPAGDDVNDAWAASIREELPAFTSDSSSLPDMRQPCLTKPPLLFASGGVETGTEKPR